MSLTSTGTDWPILPLPPVFLSEDDSDDGDGDGGGGGGGGGRRRRDQLEGGTSKKIKIGMSESKALRET